MNKSTTIEILRGRNEICRFIRVNSRTINHLIEHEGLPAWKRSKNSQWYALKNDLNEWLIEQRNKYIKKS